MRSFSWTLPLVCFMFALQTEAKAMPSAAAGKYIENKSEVALSDLY